MIKSNGQRSVFYVKGVITICFIILILLFLFLSYLWIYFVPFTKKDADALVVLGSSDEIFLKERLNFALYLLNEYHFQKIIVSGGYGEAEKMKLFLIEYGIDKEKIIEENNSKDTIQNIFYTKKLLNVHNLNTCLIISNNFHLRRVSVIAKNMSLKYRVYAVRNKHTLKKEWKLTWKEMHHIFFTFLILKGLVKSKNE